MTIPACLRPAAVAAALLAAGAGAQAQSAVSLYGLLDMGVGRFQTAGSAKQWRADSGTMTTSFLGLRGSDDLGGGLKARFAIEQFLRADGGGAGRFDGDALWARNAFVGLEGSFGATLLGRNTTPLYVATLAFNPLGDSFAFSPSIRHYFVGTVLGDTGWNNSIRYSGSNRVGVNFNLVANLAERPASGKNLGFSVMAARGPWGVALAWQNVKNGVVDAPAGFDHQRTVQLGGSYDFKLAKVYAQFGDVETAATVDTKTRLAQLGLSVPVGLGSVLASYGQANAETAGVTTQRKTFTAGYDHLLSKNTDVYAIVMHDRATGLDAGTTLAAGVRLRY